MLDCFGNFSYFLLLLFYILIINILFIFSKNVEAPPGYIQSLINKIVSNISIHCNNLILKYVEEDIVLSMNVRLLKFESADEKWEPAYTGNY